MYKASGDSDDGDYSREKLLDGEKNEAWRTRKTIVILYSYNNYYWKACRDTDENDMVGLSAAVNGQQWETIIILYYHRVEVTRG